MKSPQYSIVESEISIEGKTYRTYGICSEKLSFNDVSFSRIKVEEMINTINRVELQECHLKDYIEDSII